MCEVMEPTPDDRVCDPAAGTGGFLCNAYEYVLDQYGRDPDRDELRALQTDLVEGMELSPKVGRMCAMNAYLHGIGGDKVVVHTGHDSLSAPWSDEYSMVLANPPFGKKQSLLFVNEEGDTEREDQVVVREDFWTSTGNKQLNFVQHIYTLLKIDGRAAVVVPDNVLFEGGAGEKVRRNLLEKCRVHTLLRLPTGIWYSPGVKANVIFFDKKEGRAEPWTDRLWVYDLRTNMHFTLKQKPIRREDFDEFVECYKPGRVHERAATWNEANPDGRWRAYDYEDLWSSESSRRRSGGGSGVPGSRLRFDLLANVGGDLQYLCRRAYSLPGTLAQGHHERHDCVGLLSVAGQDLDQLTL